MRESPTDVNVARLNALASTAIPLTCLHCGARTDDGASFCCGGCEAVHDLLTSEGLGRYYELRGANGAPVPELSARDQKWIETLPPGPRLTVDVQGIQCAACVWLIEKLFRRQCGAVAIVVNPALGKMDLTVDPPFSVAEFARTVERFGYALGPALKTDRTPSAALLGRIGVCVAIAMNTMIFAIATYSGLHEGPLYRFFEALQFALGTSSVIVGGTVFFRSAWQALRHRVLHLDVPIALGIALAYAGSSFAYFARGGGAYFDTLSVFIALMLVGRFLQERVVEKNRRALLANDGAEGLLARRLDAGVVRVVRAMEVEKGDSLLVAPGDLVVVAGALEDAGASCSLEWINGESAPRAFERGDEIPAGAVNCGERALVLRAASDFDASPVVSLLRRTSDRADAARTTAWWQRFARIYVLAVFALAGVGFLGWWLATRDVERALLVTSGVLIVTCPCAFGIATPLAYELALAGLRRAGLFVRSGGFLDRARDVRRVVFDKTGTLTTGALELADAAPLDALSADERAALYNLVARSAHPKSQAIARELARRGARFERRLEVVETPGVGLELARDGRAYTLRAGLDGEIVFAVDGAARAAMRTRECLRSDAAREIADLSRSGYDVWILSGDDPTNVRALAARVDVPPERAIGGKSPDGKLAFVTEHDHRDTLVVGDGLNDSLAVARAHCSGTPAIDRPFMPARSDFYFTTPGLHPIGLALRVSKALERITRRNLAVAVAYNVVTVGLAYAGLLSPLVCAVAMPVSSITVVLATTFALSPRRALWKS